MSFRPGDTSDHHLAVSLDFRPENILGRSSLETTIFRGTFGGKQVAIKVSRLQSNNGYTNTSWQETGFLTKLDDHQNIIRHLYTTSLRDKSYIVTELCAINLRDLITQDCGITKNQFKDLLYQTTSGLAHIHANNIAHCNLTPTSILLTNRLVVKITNFESSLNVSDNLTKVPSSLAGKIKQNLDWASPEILHWTKANVGNDGKAELELTTKVDLFNLGCIYFFVYTEGDHPYGALYERVQNILENNPQYRQISKVPAEFKSVIFQLNKSQPEERPNAMYILQSSCFVGTVPVTTTSVLYNKKTTITYSEDDTLGNGSLGTTVYKGAFGGREVAVKRIYNPKHFLEVENEIDILIKCEGHPNIVRYIASEKKSDCFLLALELCHKFTLLDWVENRNCILPAKVEPLQILRQVSQGLSYLHQSNIIHRDLKPSNILFFIQGNEAIVKIADFGISRVSFQGNQRRTFTFCSRTAGWTSPEILILRNVKNVDNHEAELPKLTQKSDIFSLGCIFHFVLSNGDHPFGNNHLLQDYNISEGKAEFKETYDDCLILNCNLSLIKLMLAKCPSDRPGMEYILSHSILWNSRKMIDFITQVSNFAHNTCGGPSNNHSKFPSTLETKKQTCIKILDEKYFKPKGPYGPTNGWFVSLDDKLVNMFEQNKRIKNQHRSMIKLVRLIRNFHNHYHEKSFEQEIRSHLGEIPESFMGYWLQKFPNLINDLKIAFESLRDEECLKDFY